MPYQWISIPKKEIAILSIEISKFPRLGKLTVFIT